MKDQRPSGPETLVRDVVQGLAEGRFVPGQRLAEPDLMTRYALGRSTVREGLGRLAASGIVVQLPHRGAQIRLLSRKDARDVLRVTELLLGLAARQAAEAVAGGTSPEAFLAAAQAYRASGEARDRARYYKALSQLAGNDELDRLLPTLQVHLIRAQLRHVSRLDNIPRSEIVDAIRQGDPAAAEEAARCHIRRLIDDLPRAPESAFAPEG